MFKKLDDFFTDKRKFAFAVGAVIFALLWLFLWNAFPMQFYSLFFADIIGSNIQLALLNAVVLFIMFWVFPKITALELSFGKTVFMNIFLTAAVEYVFSIFMFSDYFFLCVIAYIIHAAVNIWTFSSAESRKKGVKTHKIIPIMWSAAFTLATDAACIGLMYIIAKIYSE